MVALIQKQIFFLFLLQMNCKKIAKGLLKSLCLYINDVIEYIKYIKGDSNPYGKYVLSKRAL